MPIRLKRGHIFFYLIYLTQIKNILMFNFLLEKEIRKKITLIYYINYTDKKINFFRPILYITLRTIITEII